LHKFFASENFRKLYQIKPFSDNEFADQFLQALECDVKDDMYTFAKTLTQYVLDKMGGFSIDGWSLRTPASGESRRMQQVPH